LFFVPAFLIFLNDYILQASPLTKEGLFIENRVAKNLYNIAAPAASGTLFVIFVGDGNRCAVAEIQFER
jgi:hypothetical protein